LGLRRILGTRPSQEARRWNEWRQADPDSVIDAVANASDPWPGVSDRLLQFFSYVRHPRAFLRNAGYDQLQTQSAGS
jgi:hypothetical protein